MNATMDVTGHVKKRIKAHKKVYTILHRPVSAAAILFVSAALLSCNPPNYPTRPIELKYYAAGPWAVTIAIAADCCDFSGNKFDLYYPTNLGQNGFLHPILTWGNGTNSLSSRYTFFLKHMASWGFVVIAAQDKNTGAGQTILDAANFLIAANNNPASMFFHKLNVSQVGSFGHSQAPRAPSTPSSNPWESSRP